MQEDDVQVDEKPMEIIVQFVDEDSFTDNQHLQ